MNKWSNVHTFIISKKDIIYFISEKDDFVILNPYTEEYRSLFIGDAWEFDAATDESEALFVKKQTISMGLNL
ncbi:MAG: hypothetical protein CSB55_03245 [Candidatus Cloacimonadota bacterium]|nr:MAG: hypothetical protein CSB55_03245 [Candidatus Cloacimonadota bacterium]